MNIKTKHVKINSKNYNKMQLQRTDSPCLVGRLSEGDGQFAMVIQVAVGGSVVLWSVAQWLAVSAQW